MDFSCNLNESLLIYKLSAIVNDLLSTIQYCGKYRD